MQSQVEQIRQFFTRYETKTRKRKRVILSQFFYVFYYRKCFAGKVKPLIFALPNYFRQLGKALLQTANQASKRLKIINDIFGRNKKVIIFALPIKKGVSNKFFSRYIKGETGRV